MTMNYVAILVGTIGGKFKLNLKLLNFTGNILKFNKMIKIYIKIIEPYCNNIIIYQNINRNLISIRVNILKTSNIT